MACSDQINSQELENAKTDAITLAEIATSRLGGSSGGALIDSSTTRLGDTFSTVRGQLAKLGYEPPTAYASGIVFGVNDGAKTVEENGVIYAPLISALPFTTSGTFTGDDDARFRVVQGGTTRDFADYAALEAIDTSLYADGYTVTVTGEGIAGDFVLRNVVGHGLTSTGITRVINSDWYAFRLYSGDTQLDWWEPSGDGLANDALALYSAIEASENFLLIPDGTYFIDASELGVPNTTDAVSQDQGDGAYPAFLPEFIPIINKKGLHIKCGENVVFNVAEGTAGFGAYRCLNLTWEGGRFLYADGVASPSYANEPFPVLITRSFVCEIKGTQSERFYRGNTIYRCIASGISGCTHINANYFCFYVSSVADVTFDNLPLSGGRDRNYIRACAASGGGTANYFADHAKVSECVSRDPDISGGVTTSGAHHFNSQFGFVHFVNNSVYDNRNLESIYSGPGNIFSSGFNAGFAISGTLGQTARDIIVRDNSINGCLIGVTVSNMTHAVIQNNDIRNYWLAGSAFYGGDDIQNVYIRDNDIGGLNASSTAAPAYGDIHRAGLSFDGDSTANSYSGFVISGNILDTGTIDAIFSGQSVDDFYIKDDNIIRSGAVAITQLTSTDGGIFTGAINRRVKTVSGGTVGDPVAISVIESGETILGTGYVSLPDIAGVLAYGQAVWYDFFLSGNGTMTIVGDSDINYRISGSNTSQIVAGSTGITLSGNRSCRIYVSDTGYNLFYYSGP